MYVFKEPILSKHPIPYYFSKLRYSTVVFNNFGFRRKLDFCGRTEMNKVYK